MSNDPWDPRNPANVRLGCYVWIIIISVVVIAVVMNYFGLM